MFQSSREVNQDKIETIQRFIQNVLSKVEWFPSEPLPVIGIGGTVRNLAKIHQRAVNYPLPKLHNYRFTVEDVFEEVRMITGKSYEERQKISGLSSERADIIIAGALVIQEILRKAKASYLTISGCGLREGLFFHYYDPIYDKNGDKQHDMLRCSVQNYLDTLPITYDFHTKYVTATALAMFDQWQKVHKLDPRMRDILAAAARLHDIGNLINYYSHARHSCYMTANAHIFGWTHSEQVMCALICAFHHGYSGKYLKANGQAHILTAAQMRQVRILSSSLPWRKASMKVRSTASPVSSVPPTRLRWIFASIRIGKISMSLLTRQRLWSKTLKKHSIFPFASSGSPEAATGMSSSKQHKSCENEPVDRKSTSFTEIDTHFLIFL